MEKEKIGLHISPVLPAYLVKGIGDLAQRTKLYGFHQFFKQVAIVNGCLL